MAKSQPDKKVTVTTLPVIEPPIPAGGGRIMMPMGELAQIFSNTSIRHLAYIEFTPGGGARGNHYHKKKRQYVYVIKGKLESTSIDLETGESQTRILNTGDLEYCPPNIAHAHKALEYTQALDISPDPYESSDTIKYSVA